MTNHLLYNCSICKVEARFKSLKNIKGVLYCRFCYQKHLRNKRKELIESEPNLKEDLIKLNRKYRNTFEYKKSFYNASKREFDVFNQISPTPKGSLQKKIKSNSYLTYQEKKVYPIIIQNYSSAKFQRLQRQQLITRKILNEKNKVKDVKVDKKKLLEGLK